MLDSMIKEKIKENVNMTVPLYLMMIMRIKITVIEQNGNLISQNILE